VLRVFYDRLIEDKDREWLFNEIRSSVNKNFQETFDVVFNNLSDSTVCIHSIFSHLTDMKTIIEYYKF
jgi:dynein heavy chain